MNHPYMGMFWGVLMSCVCLVTNFCCLRSCLSVERVWNIILVNRAALWGICASNLVARATQFLNGATKTNLRPHLCDQPFEIIIFLSLHDSESLPVAQQQTHIRPISWSKPIKDSEGLNTFRNLDFCAD